MPKVAVRDLLDQLDATRTATSADQIRQIADQAVSEASDFVHNFEACSGASLDGAQRIRLADHLWGEHVNSSRCASCPFQPVLAPWYAAVQKTQYWPAWRNLQERDSRKRAVWSAEKKLSIYLSLKGRGFQPGKPLKRERCGKRFVLKEGNNRVTMLAAIDQQDVMIDVQ